MPISDKDRDEYERGRRDCARGSLDQFITDILESHPDSEAYYKGRTGETLDDNKEDEDE